MTGAKVTGAGGLDTEQPEPAPCTAVCGAGALLRGAGWRTGLAKPNPFGIYPAVSVSICCSFYPQWHHLSCAAPAGSECSSEGQGLVSRYPVTPAPQRGSGKPPGEGEETWQGVGSITPHRAEGLGQERKSHWSSGTALSLKCTEHFCVSSLAGLKLGWERPNSITVLLTRSEHH